MKKIFAFITSALAMSAVITGCHKENMEPESETVQVKVKMGTPLKSFTDQEGIRWEVGDQIKYAGGVELFSEALKAEDISEDGHSATFTFPAALNQVDRTGWFVSTKCHPSNYNEVEFTLGQANGSVYTQNEAGEMNSRYLFLHSGTGLVNITASETPEITMDIVGTIFRAIPYTTKYNEESVLSVKMSSKTEMVGTVAYDRGAGTYRGVNDINWQKSNSVTVNLGSAFSLEGVTSAETSKGVYIAVAATPENAPLNGYQYVIETDKATYTFDAMDVTLAVGENVVKNMPLNLDKAQRYFDGGLLRYVGALPEQVSVPSTATSSKDVGYWYAETQSEGQSEWTKKVNAENALYYSNVKFTAVDNATGEPVEWLRMVYGGNEGCHWMLDVDENTGDARSATVIAAFADVKGYAVTDESKIKTITVNQAAYSAVKTLGFYGGVGDQTISGDGVNALSLGYCVITVNGTYAESWGDDKNNEQLLYGNVVIECRDGAANAPILDWITVGYGKDDAGKFNSTHLLVTASANSTGAQRRALVCCTYNAPEGYEFAGGAKSAFKQFFVTQSPAGGLKMIEFWGGIAADYTHDHTGANDWGLSYWVAQVDGSNATDWNGDSHNEQAIYGGAQFKCYDYTNGVRGAEVDWVTVEYKQQNGKVIDTWWLADLQANTTGAVRKAEIVCTVPDLTGYAYKDGQNVRSTVIIQNPDQSSSGGDQGGSGEVTPDEKSITYTIYNNAADGSKSTGFGPGAGSLGDWYRFEGITIDGKKYMPGQDMKDLAADSELVDLLLNTAFSFGVITENDVQIPGVDPLTENPESFLRLEAWSDGGAAIYVRMVITANNTGARRTFKIITKNPDGTQKSSIVYFQNA